MIPRAWNLSRSSVAIAALVCLALSTQFLFQRPLYENWSAVAIAGAWARGLGDQLVIVTVILLVVTLAGRAPIRHFLLRARCSHAPTRWRLHGRSGTCMAAGGASGRPSRSRRSFHARSAGSRSARYRARFSCSGSAQARSARNSMKARSRGCGSSSRGWHFSCRSCSRRSNPIFSSTRSRRSAGCTRRIPLGVARRSPIYAVPGGGFARDAR